MLLSSRLRRWLIFIVVAPLLGRALQLIAANLEKRQQARRSAAALSRAGEMLRNRRRR